MPEFQIQQPIFTNYDYEIHDKQQVIIIENETPVEHPEAKDIESITPQLPTDNTFKNVDDDTPLDLTTTKELKVTGDNKMTEDTRSTESERTGSEQD